MPGSVEPGAIEPGVIGIAAVDGDIGMFDWGMFAWGMFPWGMFPIGRAPEVPTLLPGNARGPVVPAPEGRLFVGSGVPTLAFGAGGLMVDEVEFWAIAGPRDRPSSAAEVSNVIRINVFPFRVLGLARNVARVHVGTTAAI